LTLEEAATRAEELAAAGDETTLARHRAEWGEEIEFAARNTDFRVRAQAYRAVGAFRFKQKLDLLRRGLEDESPACRGSALVSLERLSRDNHPAPVNSSRALLHEMAVNDPNQAVRRLAVLCLKNGSPQKDTILLLKSLGEDDEQDRELRTAAAKVSELLRKRAGAAR
jgi:HEAT repeat protein